MRWVGEAPLLTLFLGASNHCDATKGSETLQRFELKAAKFLYVTDTHVCAVYGIEG